MNARIYVETSVISYLAARPSNNAVNSSRQYFSYRLWQQREKLGLVISQAVVAEAQVGDREAVENRMVYCNALALLATPSQTLDLAQRLIDQRAIPAKAFTDAVHIATASLHEITFIASWNFRHIAGATARRNIETALQAARAYVPVIATPEEILENAR